MHAGMRSVSEFFFLNGTMKNIYMFTDKVTEL